MSSESALSFQDHDLGRNFVSRIRATHFSLLLAQQAGSYAPMTSLPDNTDENTNGDVPKAVVNRLSLYLRELHHMLRDGKETTSSKDLGHVLGFTDAQVRKDLAYFGNFGHPGIGYRCADLIDAIRGILGTDQRWPVVMVGVGNLGKALLGYKGFQPQGFKIAAACDADDSKVGQVVEDICIAPLSALPNLVQELRIRLGLVAVPAAAAQQVADLLVKAGIEGIVNFAPVTLTLPPHVSQVGVDLAIELEQLTFAVRRSQPKDAARQDS